jgi:hypothetical protein
VYICAHLWLKKRFKIKLGIKAIGRRVEEQNEDLYVLREEPAAYNTVFDHEKGLLSSENSYFWGINL